MDKDIGQHLNPCQGIGHVLMQERTADFLRSQYVETSTLWVILGCRHELPPLVEPRASTLVDPG